jgi:hypothetical protein
VNMLDPVILWPSGGSASDWKTRPDIQNLERGGRSHSSPS